MAEMSGAGNMFFIAALSGTEAQSYIVLFPARSSAAQIAGMSGSVEVDRRMSESAHHEWKQRRLRNFDYSNSDYAYFVTIRALPDTAPFVDEALAKQVIESVMWMREHRGVSIYAYCLMPDHLHLLMRLGGDGRPLGDVLGAFKRFTTRQSWSLGYKGAIWQPRFYDHVLRKSEDGAQVALYIIENPVRKGLVEAAEKYPYSGCPDAM